MIGPHALVATLFAVVSSPGASGEPTLFASEDSALAAVGGIGPEWSVQTAPPRDREVYAGPPPADRPHLRLSSKSREFTFSGSRRVLLDWDREGRLDEVQLMDPTCWTDARKMMLRNLVAASGASLERLDLVLSVANTVFDRDAKVWEVDAHGSFFQFIRFQRNQPCMIYVRRDAYGTATRS